MALVAATRSIGQHYSEMTTPERAFSRLGILYAKDNVAFNKQVISWICLPYICFWHNRI